MADGARVETFLSDADRRLLSETLTTSDPEAGTVRLRLPKSKPGPPIVMRYDVTPPLGGDRSRPYVWCGHCYRATHWKGYVVELPDGTLVNLGGVCGPKHFGFDYGAVENAFDAKADRQSLLPRIARLKSALPILSEALTSLRDCPATRHADELRSGFRAQYPRLWRSLHSFVAAGGMELVTTRTIADPEATARTRSNIKERFQRLIAEASGKTARTRARREMTEALESVEEKSREVTTRHGVLDGRAFLVWDDSLAEALTRLRLEIGNVHEKLSVDSSDALSNQAMKEALRDSLRLLSEADKASDRYAETAAFWREENLAAVVGWANANALGQGSIFSAAGNTIALGSKEVGLSPDYAEPREADFALFRERMLWPRRSFDAMPTSRRVPGRRRAAHPTS